MNCPMCDSLLYYAECRCGWKRPTISTIEIKKMGAEESKEPVVIEEHVKAILEKAPLAGKENAAYCLDVIRKILKGNKDAD
jgi:molybdopterin-guanine dinucleotide biosynthesis protein